MVPSLCCCSHCRRVVLSNAAALQLRSQCCPLSAALSSLVLALSRACFGCPSKCHCHVRCAALSMLPSACYPRSAALVLLPSFCCPLIALLPSLVCSRFVARALLPFALAVLSSVRNMLCLLNLILCKFVLNNLLIRLGLTSRS